ncbi:MAG: hypothetical protein ACI4AK_09625, partial [Lepagella sp.]
DSRLRPLRPKKFKERALIKRFYRVILAFLSGSIFREYYTCRESAKPAAVGEESAEVAASGFAEEGFALMGISVDTLGRLAATVWAIGLY